MTAVCSVDFRAGWIDWLSQARSNPSSAWPTSAERTTNSMVMSSE